MNRGLLAAIVFALSCSSTGKDYEQRFEDTTDSIEDAIRDQVDDEKRAVQLLVVQEEIRESTRAFLKDMGRARDRWIAINRNYEADPGQFTALHKETRAARVRLIDDLVRHAAAARRIATEEDWAKMAKDREE